VDRAVRTLREGGCDPVYVVSGAVELSLAGACTVPNPAWRSGMGSSLRAALRAAAPDVEAVVVALVDQPGIGPQAVARVVSRLRQGDPLVVATYDGQARNPVGIARSLWTAVAETAVGDAGARAFIADHPDLVSGVDCTDVGDPADVDTPADLARLAPLPLSSTARPGDDQASPPSAGPAASAAREPAGPDRAGQERRTTR
jgi:nicotine blue oxidoreductase